MKKVKRLFEQFRPEHYTLHLDPDAQTMTFSGKVEIRGFKSGRPSQRITLHQKGLKIRSAKLLKIDKKAGAQEVELSRFNCQNSLNELRLHSKEMIYPGNYVLELEFSGQITDQMHGIYPCYFNNGKTKKKLIATQFESHHAREAFPCVDEPEAKATFQLSLATPKEDVVISNTPIENVGEVSRKDEKLATKNYKLTTFQTTPRMSTYLLAFVQGDLEYREALTKDGVAVRAYATPGNARYGEFAIDVAVKCLEFYNDYFGTPYPLPKLDMAALPDFSSAAMENWGLVTYRENYLLFEPGKSTIETKQLIAMVVAHELAHQWFGNLVTMRWWDDLWLNESFANLMEYRAVDEIFPQWQIWEQFINREMNTAFRRDSLPNVQPVRSEVRHPDEIGTLFDPSIVYAKGGNLLNMVRHMIGEDSFTRGLSAYFKDHAYGNTSADDLWDAWGKSSGQNIGEFMHIWLNKPGFPVVDLDFDPETKRGSLSQRRLLVSGQNAEGPTWPVPLAATIELTPLVLQAKSEAVQAKAGGLLILNHDGHSYYVPHYLNNRHAAAIQKAIKANHLSTIDRLLLLQNYSLLERSLLAKTTENLELLGVYSSETEETVWSSISAIIGSALVLVEDDEHSEQMLQRLINNLVGPLVDKLGWDKQKSESAQTERLRDLVLTMAVRAERKDVVAEGLKRFAKFNVPADLSPDIREVVYYTGVKFGTAADFTKLLKIHNSTENADEKDEIVNSLCLARSKQQIKQLLGMITSDKVRAQDVPKWFALIVRNKYGRDQAWQWLVDNWQWINQKYNSDKSFDYFPRYAAMAFSRETELKKYKQFFVPKQAEVALDLAIRLGIEEIEGRIKWRSSNEAEVKTWLAKNVPGA